LPFSRKVYRMGVKLNGNQRAKAKAVIRARGETHCWRCGEAVDLTLSGNDPNGPTIGHIVETDQGGHPTDPSNYRLEHGRCNSKAGAEYINAKRYNRPHTREW